jgi:hypothetical protein
MRLGSVPLLLSLVGSVPLPFFPASPCQTNIFSSKFTLTLTTPLQWPMVGYSFLKMILLFWRAVIRVSLVISRRK